MLPKFITFKDLRILVQYRDQINVPLQVEHIRMRYVFCKVVQEIHRDLHYAIVRGKAIYYSIIYGVLPWWMYEKKCHYQCSYLHHLKINLIYAIRWIRFSETTNDRAFEKDINKNF